MEEGTHILCPHISSQSDRATSILVKTGNEQCDVEEMTGTEKAEASIEYELDVVCHNTDFSLCLLCTYTVSI